MKSHFQLQAQKGVPFKVNPIIPTHLGAYKLEKVSPEHTHLLAFSKHEFPPQKLLTQYVGP